MFESLAIDAKFALRRLHRRRTYTLLTVLTLALGVAGTAAVFGIARRLLLDPLSARRLAAAARTGHVVAQAELRLTPRELSILESVERGESVKQTARSLGIAMKTVENLQSRMFRKLGARNRAHAVTIAHRLGLLDSVEAPATAQSA